MVDDNRDSAESMSMLLEFLGASVQVAFDGDAALAAYEAYNPAVILLDIGMPGMDGYEVARRIRSEYPERHTADRGAHRVGTGRRPPPGPSGRFRPPPHQAGGYRGVAGAAGVVDAGVGREGGKASRCVFASFRHKSNRTSTPTKRDFCR